MIPFFAAKRAMAGVLAAAAFAWPIAPAHARFLQTDPSGHADDLNAYLYGRNDPTDTGDPSGHASCPPPKSCPDIKRASAQDEERFMNAMDGMSVEEGGHETGYVAFDGQDGKPDGELNGDKAGRNPPDDPQGRFTFDFFHDPAKQKIAGTAHPHPKVDRNGALKDKARQIDRDDQYPSADHDLRGTMNATNAPLFVKNSDGAETETYRAGNVDHMIVLKGPRPSAPVPSELTQFVVDPPPDASR